MGKYKSTLENPIYGIYIYDNPFDYGCKHTIIKVVKSEQTCKKYLKRHDACYGYVGYSQEVYPTVNEILKVGTDVNSLEFRMQLERCHI